MQSALALMHMNNQPPHATDASLHGSQEEDMLDLAFERRDTSRLGCQLILTKELEGLRIDIPRGANNLFDFIPFEDRK